MDFRRFTASVPTLIDLNDIDDSPGQYCMSFGFDIKPLINSIEAFGLINIPFVTRNGDGLMDIVAGYRRVMALKSLKRDKIPCIDFSDSGLSTLELLNFSLHDNLPTRTFNNVEKGMILNRLNPYVSKRALRGDYMPLLKISSSRDLDILMKIEGFTKPNKETIAGGKISLKTIGLILELDKHSRPAVFQMINDLRFNFNQQLTFIEYIVDISIKEEVPVPELLDEDQLKGVSHDRKLNTPQKAKKMLDLLRTRRFPFLTGKEKGFNKKIARLDLPKNVRIEHPPFFETVDYRLEINFRTGKELKKTVDILARIEGLDKIEDSSKKDL
ncbi:ParB/RepB/Spo0J family partition protein [Thermodesulfobacteriota bacterium]